MENNQFDPQEYLELDPDFSAEESPCPQEKIYPSIDEIPIHDYNAPVFSDEEEEVTAYEQMDPEEDMPLTDETPIAESFLTGDTPLYEYDELPSEEQSAEPDTTVEEDLIPTTAPFRDQEFQDAFGDGEEFDKIMNAPAVEESIPVHNRPPRKTRPKRRKGDFLFGLPQLALVCVWLALILVVGVTLGRMLWACAADVLAFGREDKLVTVTVYETDTIEDITNKLYDSGLIRYKGLFKLYADLAVDEGEIGPGIWDLNTNYDYHALVNMMSPSSNRKIVEDLLIPEGFSCRQIFALLEENKVCTAIDIAAYAASGELDEYWFLEGVERGDAYCLEGFLFPDTYDFYQNSSPREVLEKLLDNFEYRFTEEMRGQIDTLNANVTGGTFSVRDVVIVASMIEKEAANASESPAIASVIYNRLFNWGGNPPYLNIDASIVYALDGKTELTAEDLRIDHPYNTYTNTGLTPGAISNPGLASLKAALYPDSTNYYFYVLNPATGMHKFSTTLDEHNAFIATLE